jgi:hypothetical protein
MDYPVRMNPWFFDCAFESDLVEVEHGDVGVSTSPQHAAIL